MADTKQLTLALTLPLLLTETLPYGGNGVAYEFTDGELSNGIYFVGVASCYHCEVQNRTSVHVATS